MLYLLAQYETGSHISIEKYRCQYETEYRMCQAKVGFPRYRKSDFKIYGFSRTSVLPFFAPPLRAPAPTHQEG